MKRKVSYDYFMAYISQPGGHHEIRRWKANAPLKSITVRGHKYLVQTEKAFTLKGWYPWTKIRFFQSILDALSQWVCGIGLLVYDENSKPNEDGYILPLDRIDEDVINPGPAAILSPFVHGVIGESVLYRDAMKRMAFGAGMNWKTGTIILAGMLFLMIILYMGGYFD